MPMPALVKRLSFKRTPDGVAITAFGQTATGIKFRLGTVAVNYAGLSKAEKSAARQAVIERFIPSKV